MTTGQSGTIIAARRDPVLVVEEPPSALTGLLSSELIQPFAVGAFNGVGCW